MNILQPTLCVILKSYNLWKTVILRVERPASRCGPISKRTLFRVALFKLLAPSQMTTYKAYTLQPIRRKNDLLCGMWTFLYAVYENSVIGGKYGCCNFFFKYFVKICRLGKKFTNRLILCSFIYKSMYFTSGFVEKYNGNGLKTTMWQKNI